MNLVWRMLPVLWPFRSTFGRGEVLGNRKCTNKTQKTETVLCDLEWQR